MGVSGEKVTGRGRIHGRKPEGSKLKRSEGCGLAERYGSYFELGRRALRVGSASSKANRVLATVALATSRGT